MESQGIFQIHPKAKRFELLCRWHNSFFFYEGSIIFSAQGAEREMAGVSERLQAAGQADRLEPCEAA